MKKLVLILALSLVGCAQIPPAKIVDGANLIITRSSQMQGGGLDDLVIVNDETPVKISRGQSLFFKLPPGPHVLRAQPICSMCSTYGGNASGFPIVINTTGILHIKLEHGGFGKALIPIFGLLAMPELNFSKEDQ